MVNISKSILLASIFLIMLLCMSGTAAAAEEIETWDDFEKIRDDLSGDFILMNDLDFDESSEDYWIPLGTESEPFMGTFDGGEFTISNLFLNESSGFENVGFFGYIGGDASIGNLTLKDAELTIEDFEVDVYNIGLLAGCSNGTIENCHVDGSITIDVDEIYDAGGLIGNSYGYDTGKIIDSSADVEISIIAKDYIEEVGGLVGYSDNNIDNSYATGDISITIKDGVDADVYEIGGLVGYMCYYDIVADCYATGDISITINDTDLSVSEIGGLFGYSEDNTTNCYATGNITITAAEETNLDIYKIGGLIGYDCCGDTTGSYATGDIIITAKDGAYMDIYCIGGLVAMNDDILTNSYATGNIIITAMGDAYINEIEAVGGLIGESEDDIGNCYATGDISITITDDAYIISAYQIGGLIGYNCCGDLNNCYALNEKIIVEADDYYEIGKVTGELENDAIDTYSWNNMIGQFTEDDYEYDGEPIAASAVWNKIDWIDDGESWEMNNYSNFMLPIFTWQEKPFKADASHLKPSSGSKGGSGTGSATVLNQTETTANTTNTSGSSSSNEGFDEEFEDSSSATGDSGDSSQSGTTATTKSGSNKTVIAAAIAVVAIIAVAGGLYLYKAGKIKF